MSGRCERHTFGLQRSLYPRNEFRPLYLDSIVTEYVLGSLATRRPVVLIVEDEILLRMNAAEMIGDAGFDVVEARNADEAIKILEARPDITSYLLIPSHTGTREDGNEQAFTGGCISNARLRSACRSDKVGAASAAFRCRPDRMEM
jgi:hypothetical protein